jgi:hypothetical protein
MQARLDAASTVRIPGLLIPQRRFADISIPAFYRAQRTQSVVYPSVICYRRGARSNKAESNFMLCHSIISASTVLHHASAGNHIRINFESDSMARATGTRARDEI